MAKYNILVVEDSPTMRQLIRFAIQRIKDTSVIEAANGIEAMKKISVEKFDLILADINMPLMDGLKLLSLIRNDPKYKNIPFIIISTEGGQAEIEKGMKLGANGYLPKPIQTNDLLSKVKEVLDI